MSMPTYVQPLDKLKARLEARHSTGLTWRQIATEFDGVPAGTLCAIAKGREPRKASVRAALGLPVLLPAAACPVHGVVHTAKRCPKAAPLDYAAWRTAHLPTLLRMVAWASTPKEQRGAWER